VDYFLGVDVGTFESKGMIIDSEGKCIDTAFAVHEMTSPRPGYCEHDAESVWWGDFCKISNELLQKTRIDSKKICGVACSAIGPCLLPVDKDCKPLARAILYGVDIRAEKQIRFLNEKLGVDYVLKKYGNPITSQSIGPKLLWLKENMPDSYKNAAKFVTSSTYMVAKLTGRYCIDRYTAAYFTPMYNLETNDWDYDNLSEFCRDDQLANCHWADEIAGTVTADAAKATGLAEGTLVTVGTADAAADAVGVGVFNSGDMLLMFGSSVYIIHVVPQLITDKRFWAGPFLFRDTYMVASGMSTTGTLTRWFRDQLAPDLVQRQNNGDGNAYDLLLAETEGCPPGSNGLICLPYFSGERTPINDPSAKGMFFGLTLHHTRAHMYQACLEAVGYGIEQHFRGYGEIGIETKKVIAVGGGIKSRRWMQIVSDVCGKRLFIGGVYGAAYGDTLLAALGTGAFASVEDISKLVGYSDEVLPDFNNTVKYKPFVDVYTQLYQRNKDLMACL
jgi:xylulokinase